mmetsp:Transcript_29604/g.40164  ORF Transcript_29604/g.40164 Transcript_29604/m.40164 type:complete len:246 (+) Transcript_29604:549-1286(+)
MDQMDQPFPPQPRRPRRLARTHSFALPAWTQKSSRNYPPSCSRSWFSSIFSKLLSRTIPEAPVEARGVRRVQRDQEHLGPAILQQRRPLLALTRKLWRPCQRTCGARSLRNTRPCRPPTALVDTNLQIRRELKTWTMRLSLRLSPRSYAQTSCSRRTGLSCRHSPRTSSRRRNCSTKGRHPHTSALRPRVSVAVPSPTRALQQARRLRPVRPEQPRPSWKDLTRPEQPETAAPAWGEARGRRVKG